MASHRLARATESRKEQIRKARNEDRMDVMKDNVAAIRSNAVFSVLHDYKDITCHIPVKSWFEMRSG